MMVVIVLELMTVITMELISGQIMMVPAWCDSEKLGQVG